MANNLKTYEVVTLDGKEKMLKFDFNAACDLEDIFGKGIAAILHEEQVGFRLVRAFYWAGLKWKDRGITLDRVGAMLNKEITDNGANIAGLMEPVMSALKKSGLLKTSKTDEGNEDEDYDEYESAGDAEGENPNA